MGMFEMYSKSRITDLPFKIGDRSIVILKALPVLQCRQCGETEFKSSRFSPALTRRRNSKSSGSPPDVRAQMTHLHRRPPPAFFAV
jgi:YgiT-type zinc finger domain-containing protein